MTWQVIVRGGGEDLYRVRKIGNAYIVEKVKSGELRNTYVRIGEAKSFDEALKLIEKYAGRKVDRVADWID